MKKLKIMHVGQMIGGLDIYIRNSIINNQCDNEYILVHGDKDKNKPVIKEGHAVKEYGISLYRSLNPFLDLKALYQVIKLIKKEKPDIIHCHSAKGGIIGRVAGFLTGTKTFYTPHAFSYLCTPSKLKRNIFLFIERITRCGSYVLACSESEQEMAYTEVGYSESHALVWHNAVPDASLEEGKSVDFNDSYVCYIGRPCYQKNPLFMLDVIKKVRDKGSKLKFILLGVGYHSPELQAMNDKIEELKLRDVVLLEPWINHADCQEYVRKSLFYLTTSLYEGLPLAVIEAMSNSKAVVASKVVGNTDCVVDGKNGFLLPLNVDSFAEKIILLEENNELRNEMGVASRNLFLDKFYIKKQIKLLQDRYESIL